jgi:two-component system, chemotaxis family, chemotaxis protein CheY
MRCLLVDDSRTMRNIEKNILQALPGISFAEAGDGVEALAVIAASPVPFGFALIDWNMPNMDGLTLVKKIRETDKRTPLIMATTEAERDRVVEALKAGVSNYVVKPFTPETLIGKVKETLARLLAAAA